MISDEILGGRFKAGERLPTERELAETFGVSRNVVREAIARLTFSRARSNRVRDRAFSSWGRETQLPGYGSTPRCSATGPSSPVCLSCGLLYSKVEVSKLGRRAPWTQASCGTKAALKRLDDSQGTRRRPSRPI